MLRRLRTNKMALHRRQHLLALCQRQSDHLRSVFGHRGSSADLMDANRPIRPDQLQHDPPLHPKLPATTTGRSHSTPHLLDIAGFDERQRLGQVSTPKLMRVAWVTY
jgi:hypothetical protein